MDERVSLKLLKLQSLEEKERLRRGLPHLHLYKFYPWARKFFESTAKTIVLVAGNQLSKSSCQIRKDIHWATSPELWPKLWPNLPKGIAPGQFWYLYPTKDVASVEFEEKWKLFLPQNEFKTHSIYGWKDEWDNGKITACHFNSGVTIYFKTYAQDVEKLQSGSTYKVSCFVAGTKIATEKGLINIEALRIGDLVWTRNGLKPILNTYSRHAQVIRRRFRDGRFISGTPEHLFYTERGWVRLDSLTARCRVITDETCDIPERSRFKVGTTTEIQNQNTGTLGSITFIKHLKTALSFGAPCIGMSGSLRTEEKYRTGFTCTTLMGIALITIQKTWKSFPSFNTAGTMPNSLLKIWSRRINGLGKIKEKLQNIVNESQTLENHAEFNAKNASKPILRRLDIRDFVVRGVRGLTLNGKFKPTFTQNQQPVRFAGQNSLAHALKLCFAEILAAPWQEKRKEEVFCLKVAECPEFFANGLLVHNCDEEPDVEVLPELQARTNATDGYMSYVFTATKGQEYWREVVEERSRMKEAEVYQISAYDCQLYEDGSPSQWTDAHIKRLIERCPTEAHIQRRIFGKFAVDEGRTYESFEKKKNVVSRYEIPKDWIRYAGIDYGGGGSSHPSAIAFVAVRPDFKRGAVYKFWRGPYGHLTTAHDVLQKYLEMKGSEALAATWFDWAAKDLGTLAARAGIPIIKAEKSHDIGEGVLNSLFRYRMLDIFEEHRELVQEFLSLLKTTAKTKARDDGIDATRYCCALIPWDFADATVDYDPKAPPKIITEEDLRKDFANNKKSGEESEDWSVENELRFWAEEFEG